jgi:hypothetical protein
LNVITDQFTADNVDEVMTALSALSEEWYEKVKRWMATIDPYSDYFGIGGPAMPKEIAKALKAWLVANP